MLVHGQMQFVTKYSLGQCFSTGALQPPRGRWGALEGVEKDTAERGWCLVAIGEHQTILFFNTERGVGRLIMGSRGHLFKTRLRTPALDDPTYSLTPLEVDHHFIAVYCCALFRPSVFPLISVRTKHQEPMLSTNVSSEGLCKAHQNTAMLTNCNCNTMPHTV